MEGVLRKFIDNFKTYSFSRLINHQEVEFFFILGLVEPDNFTEYYNGTGHQVVGYLVMYKNHKQKTVENLIYFLPNSKDEQLNIKRYTYQFIESMITTDMYDYDIHYKIKMTKIKGELVEPSYVDFVKNLVGKDIPEVILMDIRF